MHSSGARCAGDAVNVGQRPKPPYNTVLCSLDGRAGVGKIWVFVVHYTVHTVHRFGKFATLARPSKLQNAVG